MTLKQAEAASTASLERRQPRGATRRRARRRPRRAHGQGRRLAAVDRLRRLRRRRPLARDRRAPTGSRTRCTCAAARRSACRSWRLMPRRLAELEPRRRRRASSSAAPSSTRDPRASIVEVRVRDTRVAARLGDRSASATRRASTSTSRRSQIGKELEIKLGATSADARPRRVFKGEIVALEPEFARRGATMIRARLRHVAPAAAQPRSATFQQVTASDIVKKVCRRGRPGRRGRRDDAPVHEFFHAAAGRPTAD